MHLTSDSRAALGRRIALAVQGSRSPPPKGNRGWVRAAGISVPALHHMAEPGRTATPHRPVGPGAARGPVLLGAIAVASVLSLAWVEPAHAYIGPGAGFAVLGSFLAVLAALLLGGVVLLTWPARHLLRARRRRRTHARSKTDRVVVLGLDGLDPGIAETMMAAGRLPYLARLREAGTYTRLATTCPAMSPVAWSSFMTGTGPGRHGIFDFLHRDPQSYLPYLSSARIRPSERMLRLGPLRFPLGGPELRSLRRSRPFWSVLGQHGIASTIIRVPITFPPEPFNGLLLSGMCVPDLRGTQGSFTFFTTAGRAGGQHTGGEVIQLRSGNGLLRGSLPGPASPGGSGSHAQAPFRLWPQGDGRAALAISGQRIVLRQGEYSDWVRVDFRLAPAMGASGICRFLLRQLSPEVELYVSPVNIDPERPALPVSHPRVYSVYLAKRLGSFATLGLAEDTWALNEGVLDDSAFLRQCELYRGEREAMLFNALENTRQGCVVCVFDTTDRVQHMFWRDRDASPGPRAEKASAFGGPIEAAYEQADDLVGRVMSRLGKRETLVVLSDHGFTAFRRGVNVNAWLRDNGYLALKPGAEGEAEWLKEVDWSRTRAYALGLGGIYLNLAGREANGIVPAGEADALKQELIQRLTGLRDEATGEAAIEIVFSTAAVNPGPYLDVAPDLLVGYAPGYRASWDAVQGKVAGPVVEDNTKRWSGDHCVDPRRVPGVLFCNQPLEASSASMIDIAPTVLALLGVEAPSYIEGRSLLSAGGRGGQDSA